MTLLSCLSLFVATPDAEAGDTTTASMQVRDKKTFGTPRKRGDNRPRRKARKRKDPYRGPFKKDKYPTQEILRPLVLPQGLVEVGVGGDYARFGDAESAGLGFGVDVGIGNIVEVGVNSGLDLAPDFAWTEQIGLRARVLVSDGKRLDFAPGLDVGIPTDGGPGTLVVGLGARHLLNKKVYLVFGDRAIPVTLGANPTVSLNGNVGLGVQASKTVAVIFDTDVARVAFGDEVNVTGIWETLVLNGRVQVTPARPVDLGLLGSIGRTWDGGPTQGSIGAYAAVRF